MTAAARLREIDDQIARLAAERARLVVALRRARQLAGQVGYRLADDEPTFRHFRAVLGAGGTDVAAAVVRLVPLGAAKYPTARDGR